MPMYDCSTVEVPVLIVTKPVIGKPVSEDAEAVSAACAGNALRRWVQA